MTQHQPDQVCERVLNAAEEILVGQGYSSMTIEAVAKQAGISKGGLLYHYASKEDLIQGMVERMVREWQGSLETVQRDLPPGPGRLIKALARCISEDPLLNDLNAEKTRRHRGLCGAIMAASSAHPHLLDPVRRSYETLLKEFAAHESLRGRGLAVMAIMDGLWFGSFFSLYTLSPIERRALLQEIEALVKII